MAVNITASTSAPALPVNDNSSVSSPVSLLLNVLPSKLATMAGTMTAPEGASLTSSYATTSTALLLFLGTALLLFVLLSDVPTIVSNKHLPSITPGPHRLDPGRIRTTQDFLAHALTHMTEARTRFADTPYRMETDSGEATVLPPRYADEVKSDARLSFVGPLRKAMHAHLRGFDIFSKGGMENHLVVDVVRQDLTRELGKVTGPLTEETAFVLDLLLGEKKDWHEVVVKDCVVEMVARLSSRVFLGEELCRNREWLDITINSTITNMTAAGYVRLFPYFLRPLVNEVLPICRRMRAEQAKARALILPIVAKRHALRAQLAATGASAAEIQAAVPQNDGLAWFERMAAKGTGDGGEPRPYHPELAQITLSVAAIHTTSDLLTQLILDLAAHPSIVPALRAEIVRVLGTQGWRKTSLYGLKLLDSCIRETQRLKPIGAASMRREVLSGMTLSDGTQLRKGSQIMVAGLAHWDPNVYENPNEWNGYRFYRPENNSNNNSTNTNNEGHEATNTNRGGEKQLAAATTSADHLAFGHGQHGCPGRFFAINEAKIALAHMLLKYDWELAMPEGRTPRPSVIGLAMVADTEAKIRIRRREAEIDLDALDVA